MGAKSINELRENKNELSKYSEDLSFAILKDQIIKNIVADYKIDLALVSI